jgi:hypothetical protein
LALCCEQHNGFFAMCQPPIDSSDREQRRVFGIYNLHYIACDQTFPTVGNILHVDSSDREQRRVDFRAADDAGFPTVGSFGRIRHQTELKPNVA